ncbi:MAG: GDSL-type esterase/lipase family protein [Mycobacteriales bacterium]
MTATPTASPTASDVTILALGDSTVWDHECVDCGHSYPHLLRDALAKTTGKRIGLIDATQQNFLTAPLLLQEITADSWGAATADPKASGPKAAIAGADIVTITLGANDVPWQRDEDPVCNGEWQAKTCTDALVKPSIDALGKVIDAIHAVRKGKPTAIRVTNFYNELIESADLSYIPNRPQQWIEKGLTSAKLFSDVLNAGICATATSHGAVCIDIYHAINGAKGTKALPANWFVWPAHARGYDQTFTADAIMRSGFAPLTLG